MSHFVVLAFGEDYEEMLDPYDENIEVEEYSDGEVSKEEMDDFVKYAQGESGETKELTEEYLVGLYERHGDKWNGGTWRFEDGVWNRYSTYNPDSKWDWYQEGGRFSDFFPVKDEDGESTLSNIDFEKSIEDVRKSSGKTWDKMNIALKELDSSNFKSWEKVAEDDSLTIEEKRDFYNNQKEVKAFAESFEKDDYFPFFSKVEDFLVSREDYINEQIYSSVAPYAYISEETGWKEKGEMGWFGLSNDKFTNKDWHEEFMSFIEKLPKDTKVTVIDCHI